MSDEINDGGPAFQRNYDAGGHNGLSLRDWFAGQAIAWAGMKEWASYDEKHAAERAYRLADAMLAARKGGAA